MRNTIRFIRKGRLVELDQVQPTETLLNYLRERELATGTKEACREGDCGACTVALGRMRDDRMVYDPVNACITLLGQVDGTEVVTVEDLASDRAGLHPVQEAMIEKHASQCGFCTPGFVMSLFTLFHSDEAPVTRTEVNDWIAGNLCRCTGYRPITEAGIEACREPRTDRFSVQAPETAGALGFLDDDEDVFIGDETRFFAAPTAIDRLADLYEQHPDATIVAGATDVGLWVTKQLRDLPKIIHVAKAQGFDVIEDTGHELIIGAGATCRQAEIHLGALDPDIGELLRRFGSKQIRSSATIGGNIANGSPIGDLPPVLIALGATVHLRKGKGVRYVDLEDFFIDYGRQDREPGELVVAISVPRLDNEHQFRCFKISKRFDQDISAVMAAFRFTLTEDDTIDQVRLAYGGLAAVPKRAKAAEAVLQGSSLRDSARWSKAFAALRDDFQPIDDHRASARYRIETAHALLGKALIEMAGTDSYRTRIVGRRKVEEHGTS